MRLALIGGGAMGEAILASVLRSKLAGPDELRVAEVLEERRQHLTAQHGVATMADPQAAVEAAELIILAVKPQDAGTAAESLRGHLADATVVSIMAGVTLAWLRRQLGVDTLIRAMPNTPAQVGEGMTVWTATDAVSETEREKAAAIFACMGEEAFVSEERYMDVATALSGSGPAYVFLFMEALVDAGAGLGLERELAQKMAIQTVLGSALYAERNDGRLTELRNQVTSPGGTTAEALKALERTGFRESIQEAVRAAHRRSLELGRKE